MEAKDLMIGDKLKTVFSQKVVKVKEIKQSCIYTENNGYEYNEIEPIPLTTEILEKNGFRKELDDDGVHFRYTLITDGISFSLKYVLSVFQWLGPLDFKYVHELQHALRLCGIKKEIEL